MDILLHMRQARMLQDRPVRPSACASCTIPTGRPQSHPASDPSADGSDRNSHSLDRTSQFGLAAAQLSGSRSPAILVINIDYGDHARSIALDKTDTIKAATRTVVSSSTSASRSPRCCARRCMPTTQFQPLAARWRSPSSNAARSAAWTLGRDPTCSRYRLRCGQPTISMPCACVHIEIV